MKFSFSACVHRPGDPVKKIANALLMVDYIAKIYADCLYRFALIDRQAGFRADTCARQSLDVHTRTLSPIRMPVFMRPIGSRRKVLEFRKGIRTDSLASLLPIHRTHFTMLILTPQSTINNAIHHNNERKKNIQ